MKAFLTTVFCAGILSLAASGESSPRATLDLDATPWQFARVANPDVAIGKPMEVSAGKFPVTVDVNLWAAHDLAGFKDVFENPEAAMVAYTLEGSINGKAWDMLVDKKDPARAEKPLIQNATDSEKVANGTVGFVTHPVTASIEAEIHGSCHYLRLKIYDCRDGTGKALLPSKHVFSAYGREESGGVAASEESQFKLPGYDDSRWRKVGVPHSVGAMGTYLNLPQFNNPDAAVWRGTVWYRKHLRLEPGDLEGKRAWLEFDSVSIGAAVYVNGKFKPGNTAVPQPDKVTHVGEFVPFALDVTNDLKPGDNVIAVRASNASNSFFAWPGFATNEVFVIGLGGIDAPVRLCMGGKTGIPPDDYSCTGKWGTCIGTESVDEAGAKERVMTQVENTDAAAHKVELTVRFFDPDGNKALELAGSRTIESGTAAEFDLSGTIPNPKLWYPNNSPYGKPVLYRVVQTVTADGRVTDVNTSETGLRTITWDADHCFVNGKLHLLRGFGHRDGYPALGSAVPEDLQWKDVQYIARCGGNTLRVGHLPPPRATVEACDALGVLVIMDSGDNEWALKGEPADTYKREYDRDMIAAYRNHPSIAIWESNNGLARVPDAYQPSTTQAIVDRWDPIWPRIVSTRDGFPAQWDKSRPIVVTYSNAYRKTPGFPSMNVEVYGANWSGHPSMNIERFDYANEKAFTNWYIKDYLSNIEGKACGWIDWMLEETQGEGYTIYLDGKSRQKSLGSSAMDGNRFPKLNYRVYENALWVDYAARPGVALQSSWNLSGVQDVDAWSNCPQVELFLNNKSLGVCKPDARTKQCTWKSIAWQAGTLRAVGLDESGKQVCEDKRISSGDPARIQLTVEPRVRGPVMANGSDAAIVTATIVDKDGNWCPQASNDITFSVSGEGAYRGSYNFLVMPGDKHSHAPGDPKLSAEGGLMRVAVQSTFTPGRVTVAAEGRGLAGGATSFVTETPRTVGN